MSDLTNLLLLLVLVAVVALWFKLVTARERAVYEARRQCEQHGLQLLDETVGLRALRLRRFNGVRMIERCYGFEVSVEGHDREHGRLWMVGTTLTHLSLPKAALASAEEAAARETKPTVPTTVVSLRPRANNRLN